MRVHLVFVVYFLVSYGMAQTEERKVISKVTTMSIDEGSVTVLHLSPGFGTSVRLPEEASSIVIGNPGTFKGEHSESEPRLVFLKPITLQPAESNALITTKSGQEINLHLVSEGKEATNTRVDFYMEFRRSQPLLIAPSGEPHSLISETKQLLRISEKPDSRKKERPDFVARLLDEQRAIASPVWQGKELLVSVGNSAEQGHQTIVAFSVRNGSKQPIEMLPPQIQLSGKQGHGGKGKQIKAEPIAITEFRMSSRRLEPGERVDGVVVFERPSFKEADEKLVLQFAEAGQVDRPVVLPLPFTAAVMEVHSESN